MKTSIDLERNVYPAYEDIAGVYKMSWIQESSYGMWTLIRYLSEKNPITSGIIAYITVSVHLETNGKKWTYLYFLAEQAFF